jgi:hypothetical protein
MLKHCWTCRSRFKGERRSFEQVMVRPGAHDASIQSPYSAMPPAIIGGKMSKELFDITGTIVSEETPRDKRCRVRASQDWCQMHARLRATLGACSFDTSCISQTFAHNVNMVDNLAC